MRTWWVVSRLAFVRGALVLGLPAFAGMTKGGAGIGVGASEVNKWPAFGVYLGM